MQARIRQAYLFAVAAGVSVLLAGKAAVQSNPSPDPAICVRDISLSSTGRAVRDARTILVEWLQMTFRLPTGPPTDRAQSGQLHRIRLEGQPLRMPSPFHPL
jgi:hypothetical protein